MVTGFNYFMRSEDSLVALQTPLAAFFQTDLSTYLLASLRCFSCFHRQVMFIFLETTTDRAQ